MKFPTSTTTQSSLIIGLLSYLVCTCEIKKFGAYAKTHSQMYHKSTKSSNRIDF